MIIGPYYLPISQNHIQTLNATYKYLDESTTQTAQLSSAQPPKFATKSVEPPASQSHPSPSPTPPASPPPPSHSQARHTHIHIQRNPTPPSPRLLRPPVHRSLFSKPAQAKKPPISNLPNLSPQKTPQSASYLRSLPSAARCPDREVRARRMNGCGNDRYQLICVHGR